MTELAFTKQGLTERTRVAIDEALSGQRHGLRAFLPIAGPAVVASVAYMDPGNFATNIEAGARYGYSLLWVVLLANFVAMLFQSLSAKLGIVTGQNLAALCRAHYPRPLVWAMWIVSEIAAMATDLAEFLGGAIGLSLLFGLPLMVGMVITGIITFGVLQAEKSGFRPLEYIIGGMVAAVGLSYVAELVIAPPDWRAAGMGLVVPGLADGHAVTLAVAIIGATVMPHAIYLHSGLTQARATLRNDRERTTLIRYSNREVMVALGFAGLVNLAMVMMSASAFHIGHSDVAEIETAYYTLAPLLGSAAAGIFLVSLMASGLSSSVVGTMAGQVIMQGFVGFRIPIWVRRLVTMLPSFAVVAMGYNVTQSLVISQMVLCVALPIPMIALILLSRRHDVMGSFRVNNITFAAGLIGAALVLLLNLVLMLSLLGLDIVADLPG